ncbi:hypothetical protein Nepgr_023846 [Nepenthes gracilis]|uniref:RNA helicase n=1 Tax=Nepenthes gracilis TaxID=150966 RepID=A0AAD3XY78_NEPGR|nr:hypothetical protein Nepgr_023846 [Nepenthes gracilis]
MLFLFRFGYFITVTVVINMSDSTEIFAAAANPPTATTTASAAVDVKRSWGDEADDDADDWNAVAGQTDGSKFTADLNVDSLAISEPEPPLYDPEDSSIQAVTAGDTPYTSASKFEDLSLSDELLKGLYVSMRFERPSKIQAITLPMILTPPHKNLIAQAHNGSGKTTCFVLGMLSRVDPKLQAPQALCICPTRELALQNLKVLNKMAKYTGTTAESAVQESLNDPAHIPISKRPPITTQIVIGTPGTVKKWISYKKLSLVYMKILVFDEADHMLAQVLLFSATFNDTVKNFVTRTIPDYNQLFLKKEELSLEALAKVHVIKDKILDLGEKVGQTIIFVRTRESASMLHKALMDFGFEVTTIQGARTTEERDKIVKEFKDGLTHINLVVNYELPVKHYSWNEPDYEVYLHRVGRAGRFGHRGAVLNLLCGDREQMLMEKIEQCFKTTIHGLHDQLKSAKLVVSALWHWDEIDRQFILPHLVSCAIQVASWNSDEDFEAALNEAKLL